MKSEQQKAVVINISVKRMTYFFGILYKSEMIHSPSVFQFKLINAKRDVTPFELINKITVASTHWLSFSKLFRHRHGVNNNLLVWCHVCHREAIYNTLQVECCRVCQRQAIYNISQLEVMFAPDRPYTPISQWKIIQIICTCYGESNSR